MSLPILILDQHALNPRFGYVLHRRWVQPYESVVGMLWKFARANRLAGHFLIKQLRANPVDPYLGLRPEDIDVPIVARLLSVTQRSVREGMDAAARDASQFLRYCPSCMSLGYHSVVHQRERYQRCPIHGVSLLATCRHCGEASAYRLDAQLLEAPFRCRHCRRTYGSNSPPLLRCKELSRERRIAVTRAAIG
jgi:hypothetical protein